MADSHTGNCPTRHAEATWREIENEIFICAPDGECIYTLSDVAAAIWRACDGSATAAEISEALVREYDVNHRILAADLGDFLDSLRLSGLLE